MNRSSSMSRKGRRSAALTLIACGLAVELAGPAIAQNDGPPLPGIYCMDAGGANFRVLIKFKEKWNGSPSFSPDGKQLTFDASPGRGNFEQGHVFVMPVAGKEEDAKDLGLGSTPSWSPDGKRIAFYIHDDNPDAAEPGVWAMNADGTNRQWLTYGKSPRWSPDGRHLVLINDPDGMGRNLFLYKFDTNETHAVLDRTYGNIGGVAWAPDGKRMAFIGNPGGNGELVIVPLVGENLVAKVRLKGHIGWRPSWSPDGKHIVLWINPPGGSEQLHRVEVDTARAPEPLAHQEAGRVNTDASWSPDGKQIVFASDR